MDYIRPILLCKKYAVIWAVFVFFDIGMHVTGYTIGNSEGIMPALRGVGIAFIFYVGMLCMTHVKRIEKEQELEEGKPR
jgi:arginine exporter protein ArgO